MSENKPLVTSILLALLSRSLLRLVDGLTDGPTLSSIIKLE